jgi:fibronectin-binding autotransporter adhesin
MWQNNLAGELILNSTMGNSKAGSATYVQAGPGTVSITGTASGYVGQNYLNGGVTLIAGNGSIGLATTGAAVNLNGGTLVGSGIFALDSGGTVLRPFNLLGNGGGLAATAGNTLTVDGVIGSAASAGPLKIGISVSSANNNTPGLLPGTGPGTANTTPVFATGTVVLTNANYFYGGTILQSGTLNINGINTLGGANYGGGVFNGGTLQYAANLSGNNGSADLTSIGAAGITLGAGGGTIDVNGNNITFASSIGNHGSGALTLKSSLVGGILNLQGANAYSGDTTVTNLALLVNNLTGSATGSGNVQIQNSGVLAGTGTLGGSVNMGQGGLLMPGGPFGALTIGGDLTLSFGSTTWIQLQHSPLNNAALNISGTLNAGGALVVTNAGASALANGDNFQLFNAANFAGAFSSLVLPSLATNLLWNTNALMTSGTLSVVTLASPTIAAIQFNGADLTVSGSGGINSWPYVILGTTNLTAGPWLPVTTNQFDSNGNFTLTLTNALNLNQPQTFYKLQLQ